MKKGFKKEQTKYNALWLSHSSLSDYLKCPRFYYLRNIWKNKEGRKVNIVSPHMSLGSAVHQVIEPLANVRAENRFEHDLLEKFDRIWEKYTGLKGGFENGETEKVFKKRGEKMIKNVIDNPGPLKNKTIKFYQGDFIPNIYLSEEDNIILCGLIDWVEYLENTDTLRVIDFKTGTKEEKEDSFQLPIYKILVESLQKRKVDGGAYWYLDRDKFPKSVELLDEDIEEVKKDILKTGKIINEKKDNANSTKELEDAFTCVEGGCKHCLDFELIKDYENNKDKVVYLGVGEYKQDLYYIRK